jgi:hypothetical protein
MQEAAVARARNLLRALPPKCSSSTALPNEGPDKALDGLHSTRWVSTAEDANPWVVLELGKPLKADTLVLTQGGTARDLAGRYDRIERVEVRLNRDKEALGFDLVPDEMQPSVLPLGRLATLSRLEIRVTRRANGKDWKGRVALSEIALERRSD